MKFLKRFQAAMAVVFYTLAAISFASGDFDSGCGYLAIGNLNIAGMAAY